MTKAFLAASVLLIFLRPTGAIIPISGSQSELHSLIAPTTRPNVTETDLWTCVTESVPQYFDGPKPSGSLDDAIYSYGSMLIETCKTSRTYRYPCDYPDKTLWCGITTTLPTSLLLAYSLYASNASSWWSVHSSSIVRVADDCPILWYKWMNQTVINAECYAEANPTSTSTTSGLSATPRQGATDSTMLPTPTPTHTAAPNNVGGRAEGGQMWAVAASGLAVTLANVGLL
ncbi:hypothetical protein P885DRAFT_73124 [Corynascus similis CBS 632.67]